MKKKDLLWYTSIGMFALFTVLCLTGLLNWLIFTGGHGTGSQGATSTIRHFFCDIHGWAGFLFTILVAVHIFLHWNYIKLKLKK